MNFYSHSYRQLILRLPETLAARLRERIAEGSLEDCEFEPENPGSDERWIFWLNSTERYPARLVNLPCIVESQKTHDNATYYKSNDIGQVLIVFNTDEEAESTDLYSKIPGYEDVHPSGLTPPTTHIVKRRFAKTKKHKKYSKEEVSRVEDIILKILDNQKMEYLFEELVDFEEYMVSEENPSGITLQEDDALLKEHPELLLSKFELTDQLQLDDGATVEPPSAPKQRSKKSKQKKRVTENISTSKLKPKAKLKAEPIVANSTSESEENPPLPVAEVSPVLKTEIEDLTDMLPQIPPQVPHIKDERFNEAQQSPSEQIQDSIFGSNSDFQVDGVDEKMLDDFDLNDMEEDLFGEDDGSVSDVHLGS